MATPPSGLYTLSLHERSSDLAQGAHRDDVQPVGGLVQHQVARPVNEPTKDRKSTRLNSSHVEISYAVFCLKKKTTPTGGPAVPRPPTPSSERWMPLPARLAKT